MLSSLSIRNVALIESADIEFGEGLNVLSGETGSGKSVILDSINFVLGAKADRAMIRHGADSCSVGAVFRLQPGSPVFEELRAMDLDAEEELVISRRYRADGRGDSRINGSPMRLVGSSLETDCISAIPSRSILALPAQSYGSSRRR